MSVVGKYNGVSAYNLRPNAIDTREMNGAYTPNQIVQTNLNYSYDFANPNSYAGSGTTVNSLSNASTGTIFGGPQFNSTTGAFECDGVNDYIFLQGWNRPANWSGGVWFLLNDWDTIPPAGGNRFYFLLDVRQTVSGNNGLRLSLRIGDTGVRQIRFRWVDSGTSETVNLEESVIGSDYFVSNTWYYLCWDRTDGTNITTWMSNPNTGVLDEIANYTPSSGVDAVTMISPLTYGCGDGQLGSFIDGDIAELHEYSSNLGYSGFRTNFENTKARYGY